MKTNYEYFPNIGSLKKVVLTNSFFELSDPFSSIKKGFLSFKSSVEIGIKKDTFDQYFVWMEITVSGKPTEQPDEKPPFVASCKMFGLFVSEERIKLDEESIMRAAQYRGTMQIYPFIRSQLMSLVRSGGLQIDIPLEFDFSKGKEMAVPVMNPAQAKKVSSKKHKASKRQKR